MDGAPYAGLSEMLVRRPRLSARSGQAVAAGLLAAIAAVVLLPACPTWFGRGGAAFAAADSDKQNQSQPSPATLQTAPPTALQPVIAPPPPASAAAVVAPPPRSI